MDPIEYFDHLLGLIKQIIIETKTLAATTSSNNSDQLDKILNDAAYSVVKNISTLINNLNEFPFPYRHISPHHAHLMESIKNLSSSILELIAASRAVNLNPYDFLTSSNFKSSKSMSIECVKAVVMAFENFKGISIRKDGSMTDLSSSPRGNGNGQHSESSDELKIEKSAVTLILNVNRIIEASIEGDYTQLVAAAKGISNEVILIAKDLKLKTLGASLKEAAVSVISLSKLVLKNKNDQYYIDQLDLAVGKVNDIIKKTIYAVKHVSVSSSAANNLKNLGLDDRISIDSDSPRDNTPDDGVDSTTSSPLATSSSMVPPPPAAAAATVAASQSSPVATEARNENREREAKERAAEAEKAERERAMLEKSRIQREREESQRQERERLDAARLERERADAVLLERELQRLEGEKLAGERLEKERLDREEKEKHERAIIKERDDLAIKERERAERDKQQEKVQREKIERQKSMERATASPSMATPSLASLPTSPMQSQPQFNSNNNNESTDSPKNRGPDLDDRSRGGRDRDEKEKQKTIGKFLSKLVRKDKKTRPSIPFDTSPSTSGGASPVSTPPLCESRGSPQTVSSSTSSLENSVSSSPIKLSVSLPAPVSPTVAPLSFDIKDESLRGVTSPERTATSAVSVSIPIVSLNASSSGDHLQIASGSILTESPSRVYLRKKTERSLNIGHVHGKHSPASAASPSPASAPSPRKTRTTAAPPTTLIINLLTNQLDGFGELWREASPDETAKLTERINSIIKCHVDESAPKESSSIISALNNMRMLADSESNDNQYQTISLRYKMTRKLGTVKKRSLGTMGKSTPSISLVASEDRLTSSNHHHHEHSSTSPDERAAQQLVSATSAFVEETIDLVNNAYEFSTRVEPSSDTSPLADPVAHVYRLLNALLEMSVAAGRIEDKTHLSSQVSNTRKLIANSAARGPGKVDAALVSCAAAHRQFIERSLEKSIAAHCNSVRVIAIQMTTIVISISSKPWDANIQMQLFATANTYCEALVRLLTAVANKVYIAAANASPSRDDIALDTALDEDDGVEDVNIWLEGNPSLNVKLDWISDEGSKTGRYVPKAGTLNKLIEALTSEKPYDISKFTKTFLLTYQSFTTPHKLMDKLIQRYNVPDDKDSSFRVKVQVRVASFMKTWVERNDKDLDASLMDRLRKFAKETLLSDKHADLARLLMAPILQREEEDEERAKLISSHTFPELMIPEGLRSPSSLFLVLNESEIARQLTLIESNIFGRIDPTEFLEQSWSREHLKHRSPNIMDLINRANKFSFWVASQILWQEDVYERAKVIEKFITIAKHLREMNNFNTLLNIFAGLNVSSINRLKKSFAQVSPAAMSTLAGLEKLMNSSGSYKHYRQTLKTAINPCLPYLPVILSDLTFMEDGNPDKIGHLINFQKRELISRAISEVQATQQVKYDYPAVEPIHTLLLELPSSSSEELYQLSILREPRETAASGTGTLSSSVNYDTKKIK
eukprot:gene17271-20596_t